MNRIWKTLAFGAAACFSFASLALANDTVRYATDGYSLGAIVVLAAENGYFKDQGIDPVVQTYAYGVDTVDAVLAGNADFGVVIDLPALTRFTTGKLVSPTIIGISKPGFHKLFWRSSIKSAADLRGKSIGVATGTAQEFVTRAYLTKNGLDPDKDVKLVSFADLFSIVGALKSGSLDAAWVWQEGVDPMKADSRFTFVADDSVVNQGSGELLMVSRTFEQAHPDLTLKTLKALQQAVTFIDADSGKAADIVARKLGADPVKVKDAIDSNRYALSLAAAPISSFKAKYDFLVNAGKIKPYDFAAQFDSKPLAQAVPTAEIDASLKQ